MTAKLNRKNALQKIQWPQTGTDHLQYRLSIHLVCLSDVKKKKLISTIEGKFKLLARFSVFRSRIHLKADV